MIRRLAAGMTLTALLGMAPGLTAAPRFYGPRTIYYAGPRYRWYPEPWYGTRVYFPPPITGELKIKTEDKDARVYVDGGYLGVAHHLKKFDLRPGKHDIELRDAHGNTLYKETVAIVPGHTTEFDAEGKAD